MADRQTLVPIFDPVRAYLPTKYWNRARDFYVFGLDFDTLAASAAAQAASFQVNVDSDFLVLSIVEVITTDTTGATEQTFPEHLIRISDNASGAQWFNGFQHAANICGRMAGDGAGPFRLPYPRLVNAGAAVTVELQNLEATARRIWIAFEGLKIYRNKAFQQA